MHPQRMREMKGGRDRWRERERERERKCVHVHKCLCGASEFQENKDTDDGARKEFSRGQGFK